MHGGKSRAGQQEVVGENQGLVEVWAAGAAFWGAELGSGMRGLGQTWDAGAKGCHWDSKHGTEGAGGRDGASEVTVRWSSGQSGQQWLVTGIWSGWTACPHPQRQKRQSPPREAVPRTWEPVVGSKGGG